MLIIWVGICKVSLYIAADGFAPSPPERLDSMQLVVDLPVQRVSRLSYPHNLADEELSQQILEEIRTLESATAADRASHQPEGYTELADCTTGKLPSSTHSPNLHSLAHQSILPPVHTWSK